MLTMIDYDFAPFARARASQVGAGLDARYERMGRPAAPITAPYAATANIR